MIISVYIFSNLINPNNFQLNVWSSLSCAIRLPSGTRQREAGTWRLEGLWTGYKEGVMNDLGWSMGVFIFSLVQTPTNESVPVIKA